MNRGIAPAAFLCACAIAAPAAANKKDEAACLSFTLGARSHLAVNSLGASGAASCDAALADPERPKPDSAKAYYIRARALHRIAAKEYDAALADLDAADRSADTSDIFVKRSFPVANQMLRAFVRAQKGDKEGAVELARAAAAARPYDVDLAYAAARLEYAVTGNMDAFVGRLRDQARLDPQRIRMLFVTALIRRKYDQAIPLYPHILFTVPQGRGGYVIDETAIEADNLLARAQLTGGRAYAFAATGQPVFARSVLAAFQGEVDRAMAEPAPIVGPDGKPRPSRSRTAEWRKFLAKKPEIDRTLARWTNLVELRLKPGEVPTAEGVAQMAASPEAADPTVLDLALAVQSAQPGNSYLTEETMQRLRDGEAYQIAAIGRFSLLDLLSGVPDSDSDGRQPKYDGGSDSSILSTEGGYMGRKGPTEYSRTIKFNSTTGTGETVSELVMMRAAELAREQQKKGFVVLARRIVPRSVTMGRQSWPQGFEAEIDVEFVDPAALPERYAGAEWRVVDADALWTVQSALYIEARAAMRAERERAKKANGGG